MIGKLLLAGAVTWLFMTTPSTPKSRATEARLNTVVANMPVSQTSPGTSGNNSYNIHAGDDNVASGGSGGGSDSTSTSYAISYNTTGWGGSPAHNHTCDHYHTAQHGHYYGALAAPFNALRDSFSALVADHNNLVTKLQQANILT